MDGDSKLDGWCPECGAKRFELHAETCPVPERRFVEEVANSASTPLPAFKPLVDVHAAQDAVRALLTALGEDPDREGLQDTPRRVAAAWAEFLDYDAGRLGTTFESAQADQMVVCSGMRVWSCCEHHLQPFWCDVSVGYIAGDKVLGLSKLGRVAHKHAHRLQLQERLVSGIAAELRTLLGHEDVAVLATGEHLCMTSRGISTPHRMSSSSIHGEFRKAEVRAEFLALAGVRS